MKRTPMNVIAAAAIGACLMTPLVGHATDSKATTAAGATVATNPPPAGMMSPTVPADRMTGPMAYSDRARMNTWNSEKEQLQAALKPGQDRTAYRKMLSDAGYTITAITTDKPEQVEYEVVKGANTFEVQIDFDKAGTKANKVDVSTNMWRADATKAAMRGEKTAMADKYVPANAAYSDRARMKNWTGEKETLEKGLGVGHDKGWYDNQLKQMGYQVTSVNDKDKDYVEYEIVKGDRSYEVQIDFDNGKSKKVDVTTNMWQSDATEKALAGKKN